MEKDFQDEMNKFKQKDFDRYLTSQLLAGSTFDDYEDNVLKWLEDIISEQDLRDIKWNFKKIMEVCFGIPVKSLDCARYILEKFFNDGSAITKIKFNFFPESLVTGKSIFKEAFSNREFRISAKMTDDYYMLQAIKRTRSSINNYELQKVHLSKLNKDFKLIRY